ncbi:beta/gamma crystallin domain-containing protein 1-like isoform X2 [Gouania willdenowi]|uniref:beta/gamma crystallin domain-containing protein 1-like isoform X2 n=1 Tax=Gouania willdenowi TaxID=441366 RepID=UPI0010559633|nr:beta/gamma crystallin domain-containing protein 1-like isoform X2 [Gouania willdenowi]
MMSDNPEDQPSTGVLGRIGSWLSPWRGNSPRSPTENASPTSDDIPKSEEEKESTDYVRNQTGDQQCEEDDPSLLPFNRDFFPCEGGDATQSAHRSSTKTGEGGPKEEELEGGKEGSDVGLKSGNLEKNASHLTQFPTFSKQGLVWDSDQENNLLQKQAQAKTGKKLHVYLEETSVIRGENAQVGQDIVRTPLTKELQVIPKAKPLPFFHSPNTSRHSPVKSISAGSESDYISADSQVESESDKDQTNVENMGRKNSSKRKARKNSHNDGTTSPLEKMPQNAQLVPNQTPTNDDSGTSQRDKSHLKVVSADLSSKLSSTPQASPIGGESDTSCSDAVKRLDNFQDSNSVSEISAGCVVEERANMEKEDRLYKVERKTETPESKRRSMKVSRSEVKFFSKCVPLKPKDKAAGHTSDFTAVLNKSQDDVKDKLKTESVNRIDNTEKPNDEPKAIRRITDKISIFERQQPDESPKQIFRVPRSADVSPVRKPTDKFRPNVLLPEQRSRSAERPGTVRSSSPSPVRVKPMTIKERARIFTEVSVSEAQHTVSQMPAMTGMCQQSISSVGYSTSLELDSQGKLDPMNWMQSQAMSDFTLKASEKHTTGIKADHSTSTVKPSYSKTKDTVGSQTAYKDRNQQTEEQDVSAEIDPPLKGQFRINSRPRRRKSKEPAFQISPNSQSQLISDNNQEESVDGEASALGQTAQKGSTLETIQENILHKQPLGDDKHGKDDSEVPKMQKKHLSNAENVHKPDRPQGSYRPPVHSDEPDIATLSTNRPSQPSDKAPLISPQNKEKAEEHIITTSKPAKSDKELSMHFESKGKETVSIHKGTEQHQSKETDLTTQIEIAKFDKSEKVGGETINKTEEIKKEKTKQLLPSNESSTKSKVSNGGRGNSRGEGVVYERDEKKTAKTQPVNERPRANQPEPQKMSESSSTINLPVDTHLVNVTACPSTDTNEEQKSKGSDKKHGEVNPMTNVPPELQERPSENSGTKKAESEAEPPTPNSLSVEKNENSLDESCAHGDNDAERSSKKGAPEKGTAEVISVSQKLITESTINESSVLPVITAIARKSDVENGFNINSLPSEVKLKVAPVHSQSDVTECTDSKASQNSFNKKPENISQSIVSNPTVNVLKKSTEIIPNVTESDFFMSNSSNGNMSSHSTFKNNPVIAKTSQTPNVDKLSFDSNQRFPLKKLQLPIGLGKVDSSDWQNGPSSWLDVDFPKQKVKVQESKLTSSGSESNLLDTSMDDDDHFVEKIKKLCAPFSLPPRKHNQLRPPQPPFAMPAIKEDRFEKVFDPEEFTIGLRKKTKFSLDNKQSLLSMHHNTETKPALKPARASLADRCMLVNSLDPHSRLREKTSVKDKKDVNEDAEDQLKVKSRLERSSVLSSLVASNLRGKRNGVETIAEITHSGDVSPSEPLQSGSPPLSQLPLLSPTASEPIKDTLFEKKEEEAQAAQAVVCDSGTPLPSLQDTKLPDYLEKYLPQDQASPGQSLCTQDQVKLELNGKMTTPAAERAPDTAAKPELTFPDSMAPSFSGILPNSSPARPELQHPPAQPQAKLRSNVSAIKRGVHKRPGKMVVFEKPQFSGQAYEINRDLADATSLQLSPRISVKVVRGCWLLYEKPNFQGRTIALEEGGTELTNEWADLEPEKEPENIPPMQIGSIRFAVGDYSIPHIDLFSEPEGLGRVTSFNYDAIETGSFGVPLSTASIRVHSGVWLVWSDPGYQGMISVLEKGEYPVPESWGFTSPFVGSLRPLKIGGFKVENPNEVKAVAYEKPGFEGCSLDIDSDVYSLCDNEGDEANPDACKLKSVGSLRIIAGFWVGYSQPGFEGQQYILEEGEYLDCSEWGGSELLSLRPIISDFLSPHVKMFSDVNFGKLGVDIELTVPVINMDDTGYGLKTRSADVLSGVWVVFEEPGFCGELYILEKGLYGCPEDWGAQQHRVGSTMPVLLDDFENTAKFKVQLFSDPGFQGSAVVVEDAVASLKDEGLSLASCKVVAGSWMAFEGQDFTGKMYVLEEGSYADLRAMGCIGANASILSLQPVGFEFSLPSITLFERSGLRGKRVVLTDGSVNLCFAEGCGRVQSVLVEGGMWVLYEGINYRGAQILLRPGEVPDWHSVSRWQKIGSVRPLTQKKAHFCLRNRQSGMIMSVTGDLDDIKLLRIQETAETGGLEQIWFYNNGHLHCKLMEECCLSPVGSVIMAGSRVGLAPELSNQTHLWSITPDGFIRYTLTSDLVLEIKGGDNYDKNQVILNTLDPRKLQQRWDVEIL